MSNSAQAAFDAEIRRDFTILEKELLELKEDIKMKDLQRQLKSEKIQSLQHMIRVHEILHDITKQRMDQLELTSQTASNNLAYKTTLLETFQEGVEVKSKVLGTLEHSVYDQTRKLEILTSRRNVARYCLEARQRQVKLLVDHVAGALEERSGQKDAMAKYHTIRLREHEKALRIKKFMDKWNHAKEQEIFTAWRELTQKILRAKRIMRGTFLVWQMRRLKSLEQACFREWREYISQKKAARQRLKAILSSEEVTQSLVFHRWLGVVRHKQEMATTHANNALVSRMFVGWRQGVRSLNEWRAFQLANFRAARMTRIHEHMREVFDGWREAAHTQRINRLSVGTYDTLYVGWVFSAWRGILQAAHDRRESERQAKLAKLRLRFTEWRDFTQKRRVMRRAIALLSHSLEGRAFRALQHNVHTRQLARRAVSKMQNPVLAKALTKWRTQVAEDKAIRAAFLPLNRETLHTALTQWKTNASHLRQTRGVVFRLIHPEVAKAFNSWKEVVEAKRRWKPMVQAFDTALVRGCFNALRSAAADNHEAIDMARNRAVAFNTRFYFQQWRQHIHDRKVTRSVVLRLRVIDLAPVFAQWRKKVQLIKIARDYLRRLDMFHEKVVFDQWRSFVTTRKRDRQRRQEMFLLPIRRAFDQLKRNHEVHVYCRDKLAVPTPHEGYSRPLDALASMPAALLHVLSQLDSSTARPTDVAHSMLGLTPRYGHRMLSVDNGGVPGLNLRGDLWVFGGRNTSEFFGDLVTVDLYGCVKRRVGISASSPQPRSHHSFHHLPAIDALLIYGGFFHGATPETVHTPTPEVVSVVRDDLWLYRLAGGSWEFIAKRDVVDRVGLDVARCCHVSCVWQGMLWIFGGFGSTMEVTNNMLRYTVSRNEWIEEFTSGSIPEPRSDATSAVLGNGLFVFGGSNRDGRALNDLYRFDFLAREWSAISVFASPSPRFAASAFVWRNTLVLVGGAAGGGGHVGGEVGEDVMAVEDTAVWTWDEHTNLWENLQMASPVFAPAEAAVAVCGQSFFVLGGLATDRTASAGCSGQLTRVDLEYDTLQLLKVGGLERVGQMLFDGEDAAFRAMNIFLHLTLNPTNCYTLLTTSRMPFMAILSALTDPTHPALQPIALRIIANVCRNSRVPVAAFSKRQRWLTRNQVNLSKLLIEKGVFELAVETWRGSDDAEMRKYAVVIVLTVAHDPDCIQEVFDRSISLQDLASLATHPAYSVRLHASSCLSSLGLHAGQSPSGPAPFVSVTHSRILAALFGVLTGGISGQRASQRAMDRAAEAMVMVACEAGNKASFLKYFEDEDCALLTRMMESRNPLVQRAGCTVIRWLTYKNDVFSSKLVASGAGTVLARLALSTLNTAANLTIAANVTALMRYLGTGESAIALGGEHASHHPKISME